MADTPGLVAILCTVHGPMHIFSQEALVGIVSVLPIMTNQENSSSQCILDTPVDGFSVRQWVSYAKKKAAIASRVCRENGRLKAAVSDSEDELFAIDPWAASPAPIPNREANEEAAIDPWSGWGRKLDDPSPSPLSQKCIVHPSEPIVGKEMLESAGTDMHGTAELFTNTAALLPPSTDVDPYSPVSSGEVKAALLASMGVGSFQNG